LNLAFQSKQHYGEFLWIWQASSDLCDDQLGANVSTVL